jgi:hypothetical protein
MAFSYDVSTNTGLVRLELGDTAEGAGIKPNGSNFSDEELGVWLTREGSVMRACAAACEALAWAWSSVANTSSGPLSEDGDPVAAKWAAQGKALRAQYGYGATGADYATGAFVGGFVREEAS